MSLEKRMYFLVPYNISPIQQAIQSGHAALRYAHKYGVNPEYIDFIENWETWIILNGGTTNNSLDDDEMGSLNADLKKLIEYNSGVFTPEKRINYVTFYEPDLNNALTAICLVVDEKVFNRKEYPEYKDWEFDIGYDNLTGYPEDDKITMYINDINIDNKTYFLKQLLNSKKLA